MDSAGRERGREIRKRPAGGGKRQEDARKILNRGNEPKDLLKTQHLAFFLSEKRTQNELKTNSILSAKSEDQSENKQDSGVRIQEQDAARTFLVNIGAEP